MKIICLISGITRTAIAPLIVLIFSTAYIWSEESGQSAPSFASQRPNVLFIAVDDMNDWVGCLKGHPQVKTPNIDRLAERGVLFTRAYCSAPVCGPSRASLFSGRQPFNTGLFTNSDHIRKLRPDLVTIPQYFKRNGYKTMGAGKLIHGGGKAYPEMFEEHGPGFNKWSPFTRKEVQFTDEDLAMAMAAGKEFPTNLIDRGPGKLKAVLPFNGMPSDRHPWTKEPESFDWGPVDVPEEDMSDSKIADWAIEKLGEKHDKPFFLGVGFYRPHQPLFVPRKYYDMYPLDKVVIPEVLTDDLDDLSEVGQDFGRVPLTSGAHSTVLKYGQWKNAVASYLACISCVDNMIGRVLDALDSSSYADNTVIVLWSDHGWHLGEKEHWGKFTGWERSTHVPLIFAPARNASPAGFKAGARSDQMVSLIDIYPTLLDLTGLPKKEDLDGESLAPMFSDPNHTRTGPVVTTFGRGNHTLRTPRWRYIRYYDGSEELYDQESDPHEWINLASDPEHTTVLKELAGQAPKNEKVTHFVRMGDWKAVLHKREKDSVLYHLVGQEKVSDFNNVAGKHPEILAAMRRYIDDEEIESQYVIIPAEILREP